MLEPITLPAIRRLRASAYTLDSSAELLPDFSTTHDPDASEWTVWIYDLPDKYTGLKLTAFGFVLYIP